MITAYVCKSAMKQYLRVYVIPSVLFALSESEKLGEAFEGSFWKFKFLGVLFKLKFLNKNKFAKKFDGIIKLLIRKNLKQKKSQKIVNFFCNL
jgi:hypothetical protein